MIALLVAILLALVVFRALVKFLLCLFTVGVVAFVLAHLFALM